MDRSLSTENYCPAQGKNRCDFRGYLGKSSIPYCTKFDKLLVQGATAARKTKCSECLVLSRIEKCWCGSKGHLHTSRYSEKYHVSCSKTNDHVPWYDGFYSNGGFQTEIDAVHDWNKKISVLRNFLTSRDVIAHVSKFCE